jgi:hypothetical protein
VLRPGGELLLTLELVAIRNLALLHVGRLYVRAAPVASIVARVGIRDRRQERAAALSARVRLKRAAAVQRRGDAARQKQFLAGQALAANRFRLKIPTAIRLSCSSLLAIEESQAT